MTNPSNPSVRPSPEARAASSSSGKRRWLALLALPVIAVPVGIWMTSEKTIGSGPTGTNFLVTRGDLRVSIVETGSLRSEKPVRIVSQLEGQNTILKLVPEGTTVQEGDLLVELDASRLVENQKQQQITYERANAAFLQAKEELDIQLRTNESQITAAELEAEFAEKDLEKYTEGDWPQEKQQAEADITIAEEELKRAIDRSQWSDTLALKGFISASENEADKLAVKKRRIDVDLAKNKLDVLQRYTNPKELKRLDADSKEKKNELERVKARCRAALAQKQADLQSKKSMNELEKSRLDKWNDQIEKATIRAPQSGMVVYATTEGGRGGRGGGNDSPIQEGATVRERETIVTLPDLTKMIADTKIHESALDRVEEGQPARVDIDALPGRPFHGRVIKVALLPDVQQSWLNPDLKVYTTEIALVGDTTMLRPGMSCSVEIIVDDLEDVLYVPVQSVRTRGEDHIAFVSLPDGSFEERTIEIGKHNDKFVHITSSLQEGELVLLTPPQSRDQAKVLPRTGESASNKPKELPPVPEGATIPEPKSRRESRDADEAREGDGRRTGPRGAAGGEDFRERMKNMTPEEREKMRERFQRGEGGSPKRGGEGADRGGR